MRKQVSKGEQPPTTDLGAAPAGHSAGGQVGIQALVPPKPVQVQREHLQCKRATIRHTTRQWSPACHILETGPSWSYIACWQTGASQLQTAHLAPSNQCIVRSHQPAPSVPCGQLTSYPKTSTLWDAIRGCRAARSPGFPWYCSGCRRSGLTNLETSWTQCPTRMEGHTMTEGCGGRPPARCSATEAAGQGVSAVAAGHGGGTCNNRAAVGGA